MVRCPARYLMLFNENCPTPIILEDDEGIDEESEDATVENHVDIQYWFPNNGNPTCSNSVFHSQSDLVDALLNCKEPTLIFTSKNYQPDYKLTLPLVFPTHFPFGSGGIEEDRRTHVSIEECLKHYLNISKIQHIWTKLHLSNLIHTFLLKNSSTGQNRNGPGY